MNLQPGFSEVYKLCQLIFTIPSNTASAERSFSALKRINTCFRCRRHQERLSGLSLIAFEKSVIKLKTQIHFMTLQLNNSCPKNEK